MNFSVIANFGSVFAPTYLALGEPDFEAGNPIAIDSSGGTIFLGGEGSCSEGAVYAFTETTPSPTPDHALVHPLDGRHGDEVS